MSVASLRRRLAASSLLLFVGAGEARSADDPPSVTVAAVQYAGRDASAVDASCASEDANCAVEALVRRAASRGAGLVVTAEYGLAQRGSEPAPPIGDLPVEGEAGPLVTRFAGLARQLGIYLVIGLETHDDAGPHNSQIAFDPEGRVVGRHHKIELFGSERRTLVAGDGVMAFDTPFGRVGLLICADIYAEPRWHEALRKGQRARILALSSMWTVPRATRWQAAFARDWGFYVVAANSSRGEGRGGGVFAPDGRALDIHEAPRPALTLASIPARDVD